MSAITYLSQRADLPSDQVEELQKLESTVGIKLVDKDVKEMSAAEIIFNLRMLQKYSSEADTAAQAIQDNATLKQRILELEADVVKYQKLYFAISRPS